MVSISAECGPLYWLRYLPIVARYVEYHSADISADISVDTSHLGRHIDRHWTNTSVDTSVNTRPICRPIHRSSVGRYVDQDVDWYIGRGVHKIHMIPFPCFSELKVTGTLPDLSALKLLLKHKQANINVKSRRFGVILTPFSRQIEQEAVGSLYSCASYT